MSSRRTATAEDGSGAPAASVFQRQWATYRKVLDHDYMFHREVYQRLHRLLIDEAPRPFRFLDLGCGDATASVTALAGTPVAAYHGIDLSQPALDLAREAVGELGCPVTLERRDFVAALRDWTAPVDVVWSGQSLHHLRSAGKLEAMRRVRELVGEHGLFLAWEAFSLEGESRDAWLGRFEQIRPSFTALSEEEWDAMADHTRLADFPETGSRWRELGRDAGFARVRELFVAPHALSAMYCFSP